MNEPKRREHEHDVDQGNYHIKFAFGLAFLAAFVIIGLGTSFMASWMLLLPAVISLAFGIKDLQSERSALQEVPGDQEKELLSAIREYGGHLTPAEAAMETSLTVKEADQMLSGLAGEGHLLVESRGGTLTYGLPSGSLPTLEEK